LVRTLSCSTRSGFGVYRYALRKMLFTMLNNRLMLLQRRLRLRHCEVLRSWVIFLTVFRPASMG
jgi:hypothetical protein